VSDPYEKDPPQPKPPEGVVVEQVPVDSAEYLDGMDEIAGKYPPGFFDQD
jgi:hypothetical protein